MSELNKYEEQFERVKRWYDRFRQINEGKQHDRNSEYDVDDVYAFFINCFHLKDWIKKDDSIISRENVEDFIKITCMQICKELCHGLKHLKLKKYEHTEENQFGGRHASYDVSAQILKIKFTINTPDGEKDAFEIATECMEKWEEFISNEIKNRI